MKRFRVVLMALAIAAALGLSACGPKTPSTPAVSRADVSEVVSETAESEAETVESEAETSESEAEAESEAEEISGEKYTFQGVTITIPEDFETSENNGIGYVYTPTYPDDGDNITFAKSNEKAEDYSVELLNNTFGNIFDDFAGVTGYTEFEIDGYPAIKYEYDASYQGTTMHQKQVAVFTDDAAVFITFTGLSDTYADDFKAIENSITVE